MRVKINELQEGCILTENVYGMTNHPIIKKKTVLTNGLIDILKNFLIPYVEVDHTLVNGTPFMPAQVLEEEKVNSNSEKKDFTMMFLHAAQEYKREFQLWKSNIAIDISKIRMILLPLLDEMKERPYKIFFLHHYSNNEEYQYQHAVVVGLLCGFIADKMNYPKGEMVQIALAGFLSDCGMSKINPAILQKRSTLTSLEYEEIKNHSKHSYQMVQHIPLLTESTKVAIIQHHERLDGSGYPFGLKSNKIHPVAKIIAVADTYHAMTSERLYRSKQSPFRVLELMQQDYFGKFDLPAIKALSKGIMNISIGSKITLSNGQTGEVCFVNEKSPTRPLIKITGSDQILNLAEKRQLFIEEII